MITEKTRVLVLAAAAALAAGPVLSQGPPQAPRKLSPLKSSCYQCHAEFDEAGPTAHYQEDIHFQRGLGCDDCHGGNPAAGADGDPFAAHDEEMGFAGKPARVEVPDLCARCHSDAAFMKRFNPAARVDQLAEYKTSAHGRRIAAGDGRVAVCIDCHGVHGILPADDPRAPVFPKRVAETCAACHSKADLMDDYGLRSDAFHQYKQSVHAAALYEKGDTSAPTCNDCHGNHGAAPPGVGSVANVCGVCHVREAGLFREAEERLEVDLSEAIPCATCHSNHAILRPTPEMLGVGPKSACTDCHSAGDGIYEQIAEMGEMRITLEARLEEAHALLERAERKGMEVGPDLYALTAGRDQIVELRVLAHAFDAQRYLEAAGKGLATAEAGVAAGHRAFDELRFRRIGLLVSLVVILAVIIALVFKIRQIER